MSAIPSGSATVTVEEIGTAAPEDMDTAEATAPTQATISRSPSATLAKRKLAEAGLSAPPLPASLLLTALRRGYSPREGGS